MPVVRRLYRPRLAVGPAPVLLHLGCGYNILPGWINTDVLLSPGARYLDVRKPFPFPDASVDLIFCEDFIEHFSQRDAFAWLHECCRVLSDDGVIRLCTPEFRSAQKDAMAKGMSCAHVWDGYGHLLLYGFDLLKDLLELAGFHAVRRQEHGVSSNKYLCGLETRPDKKDVHLIVEATKG